MIDRKAISERIREVMREADITQKGLADRLGISQPAVSLYLQGRMPPPEVLLHIARLGNTTVEWLLTGGERQTTSDGLQIRETPAAYGTQAELLRLWQQLPPKVQKTIIVLLRHLVERKE